MRRLLTLTAAAVLMTACGQAETEAAQDASRAAATDVADDVGSGTTYESDTDMADKASDDMGSDTTYAADKKMSGDTGSDTTYSTKQAAAFDGARLRTILAAQPDAVKARYDARHPAQTLEFFGITPGMAVGEALPGGGWYTKILAPYLGEDGTLVGIDYSIDLWPEFSFANEAFIEDKKTWPAKFVADSAEWNGADGPTIQATTFGGEAGDMAGTLDAILFIRALHNLNRFEPQGGFMTEGLAKTHALLKPGGIVGVVQHRGPESNPDDWATGSNGYLKQSDVIAKFEAAGFELVKSSEINANPKDKPTAEDGVWRLPPTLGGVGDDAALKAERMAIGETDRMTLLFRKT